LWYNEFVTINIRHKVLKNRIVQVRQKGNIMSCYKHPNTGAPRKQFEINVKDFLNDVPIYCEACKGSCYVPGDQHATQENVREKFGTLYNECVDGAIIGDVHCPFAGKA
jgi:hypothetical protein